MTPCKECSERHQACHVSCEKYKQFRSECDERRRTINEAKTKNYAFTEYRQNKYKRIKRNA